MSSPLHILQSNDPNDIFPLVQFMKPIIFQSYPSPCQFLPLRPEPYHQRPVFSQTPERKYYGIIECDAGAN